MDKERLIKREIVRLNKLYKDLPKDIKKAAEGLIHRAAFMRITLQEYEKDLDENGYVELFTQSEKLDPYERERPVARLYTNMVGRYASVCKQLFDLLPGQPEPKDDELIQFIKRNTRQN